MNAPATPIDRLRAADAAFRQARDDYERELREIYPAGADVTWRRGGSGNILYGRVAAHCYGVTLRVRNSMTGRTYTITAFDILAAAK